jgi:lipopolysaccharide biosynthesis glycosyltransferase
MKDGKIVVFLSIDKAYLVPATVTIFSLLKSNPTHAFRIYLTANEVGIEWINPLLQLIEEMGSEPVLKPINGETFSKLKLNLHFTAATYYRVLAAELIDESKAIYLDSDMVIHGDISELWKIDMGDYPVGAVEDPLIRDVQRLGLDDEHGYFNSGTLLMNLDQWRKIDLGPSVIDFARNNPTIIPYLDQCSLNAVLKGNWYRLDPKWNVQSAMLDDKTKDLCASFFSEESFNEAIQGPRVIHYTGIPKPWNMGATHPYTDLFWKYLKQTNQSRKLPLNFTVLNLIKSWFPVSLKKKYWRFLKKKELALS